MILVMFLMLHVLGAFSFAAEKCQSLRSSRHHACLPDPPLLMLGDVHHFCSSYHRDLVVIVDVDLKIHCHVGSLVGEAGGVVTALLAGTVNRSALFMKALFISHVRPLLDFLLIPG